jgi:hypothetical protein
MQIFWLDEASSINTNLDKDTMNLWRTPATIKHVVLLADANILIGRDIGQDERVDYYTLSNKGLIKGVSMIL